jgi:hypothetical protein
LPSSPGGGRCEANSRDEINIKGFEQARIKIYKMIAISQYLSRTDNDKNILQNLNKTIDEEVI